MSRVFLRRQFVVKSTRFEGNEDLELQFNVADELMTMRYRRCTDLETEILGNVLSCEIEASFTTSDEVCSEIRAFIENGIPVYLDHDAHNDHLAASGILKEVPNLILVGLAHIPSKALRSFVARNGRDLEVMAKRITRSLQWRFDASDGSHDPLADGVDFWSLDGREWFPTYEPYFPASFRLVQTISFAPEHHAIIIETLQKGEEQPLAHEMLREASSLAPENPRSALVVAVTAAEIGVKHCIARLAPDTSALLDKMASPPIFNLYRDILPALVTEKTKCNPAELPTAILKRFQTAVEARNRLVHKGTFDLSWRELDDIIEAIRRALWFLDYFTGAQWALEYAQRAMPSYAG